MVYSMLTHRRHTPIDAFLSSGHPSMTPRRLQLGLALFTVFSGGVLFNVLYIQGGARIKGPRVELGRSPEDAAADRQLGAVARATAEPQTPPVAATQAAASPETIRAIQVELEQRGYGVGAPDGAPGLVTRAAILAFEVDQGLALTAEPSETVLHALLLGPAAEPAAGGAASAHPGLQADQLIRTVQQSLIGLGYGPVKVDGRLGEETVAAIRRFEREAALPETGRISAQMVAKLARLAAQGQVRQPPADAQHRQVLDASRRRAADAQRPQPQR